MSVTSEKLREAAKREPFRPFRLHLGGGRALDVLHPEFLAVAPNGRTAVIFGRGEEMEIVDILMIQSIEFLPERKGGQGRRRAG